MRGQPRDDIERQVRALELRIGIDHDGNIDGIGNGTEIALDLRVADREIRFEDRENTIGADLLAGPRLLHRIRRRSRGNAGDHRHAPVRGFDGGLHHRQPLRPVQIGEFAGRAERRQPVHLRLDEVIAQPAEHIGADVAVGVDRRDQVGKDAVEVGHGRERAFEIREFACS